MVRKTPRPAPTIEKALQPHRQLCAVCDGKMRADYSNWRTVTTLEGVVRLTLQIRRCANPGCPRFHRPYRPEVEGGIALPQHEFGLDIIALVGTLRYRHHQTVPEIHEELLKRQVVIAPRTVTNLLDRYDELVALSLGDDQRLQEITGAHGRVILALDGLQPDVGQEVLWVLRDCLSGEVLLARSLLSATQEDLASLLLEVQQGLRVPIEAVLSDGQLSIRRAAAHALPGIPHQLCHFHYLREAAQPVYEADRHAKKELKKKVRGVRAIERQVEGCHDPEGEVSRGYCAAVRSALTDDGLPPLAASGIKLQQRLMAISQSLERVSKGGVYQGPLTN